MACYLLYDWRCSLGDPQLNSLLFVELIAFCAVILPNFFGCSILKSKFSNKKRKNRKIKMQIDSVDGKFGQM